ncbi:DUF3783 domain-containing protein [Eubacterium sp. 14-2]|uniref:DUF3783 domain-containing protein n=1 Tax=Eubacterium sp. 14-2 TaxID=1235790 RepID=UPI0004CF80A1|nr:DUF3783 domain-containing protein [Eubacterium sp. 14-2]
MRETILLFHFSDKDRRNKLTRALLPLGMKIREVVREDYLQPAGYLAGNKEILPVDEIYTGEELAGEMILMAGLSNSRVDGVLKAIRKSGIGPVPYKAVLTPANQEWNVIKLFQEIKSEHEQMEKRE